MYCVGPAECGSEAVLHRSALCARSRCREATPLCADSPTATQTCAQRVERGSHRHRHAEGQGCQRRERRARLDSGAHRPRKGARSHAQGRRRCHCLIHCNCNGVHSILPHCPLLSPLSSPLHCLHFFSFHSIINLRFRLEIPSIASAL